MWFTNMITRGITDWRGIGRVEITEYGFIKEPNIPAAGGGWK